MLPILLMMPGNENSVCKLQAREEIPLGDPQLRNLMGVKATDLIRLKKYNDKIEAIIKTLDKALNKIKKTKTFANKKITDLKIIQVK